MTVQSKICPLCGATYARKAYENDVKFCLRVYCSLKCNRTAQRRTNMGKPIGRSAYAPVAPVSAD